MKKIETFNKPQIVQLRSSIDKALDQVAKEYGITISAGNCSFSGNEANFKLKLNTIGEGGTVITRESQNWDFYKNRTNCSHLSIGDKITIQGNSYTLSGYNTRARKAPINFTDSRGNGYKCSINMLNMENSK
jgi:hypothetical protein|tara:strand:+ start:279 stop:674 length:396 start_codon:yes stop_codon:yes gene_type:complete